MKLIRILGVASFIIAAALLTAFISLKNSPAPSTGNKGFAVIELFTSEGCFSCPPADVLVAKLNKESADKAVFILAYHVDYWNSRAWKDQFSSTDFSRRQHQYAKYLRLQSVYTPQIVVNGKTELVGSHERELRNAISDNLQNAEAVQVTLNVTGIDEHQAILKFTVAGEQAGNVLQVAVVEKAATSKVGGGENAGRTLSHVQIVRKLQPVNVSNGAGTVNIGLPDGFNVKSWEIVGFLQNNATGVITAAARATF